MQPAGQTAVTATGWSVLAAAMAAMPGGASTPPPRQRKYPSRGAAIAAVMKEKDMLMGAASAYVKRHKLY